MIALPEGTVTFLFTDVEGSTRLQQELGALRTACIRGERCTGPRRIGEPDVAAGWAEGRAMSEGDAVSLALTVAGRTTA